MRTLYATIPDDWTNNKYCLIVLCVPNSPRWIATVKAAIHQMARGWFWRADGKDIRPTLKIAWDIYDSICMTCSLDEISASIKLNNQLMKHLIATLSDGSVYDDDYYLSNKSSFPSVFYINQLDLGTGIRDWSIAELFSSSFFASYTKLSQALSSPEVNFGWLGLGDILKRAETALRHIDAKLSRDGIIRNVLADGVPFYLNPIQLPQIGALLQPYIGAYTAASVFTYDRAAGYENEWLLSGLMESLRSGVRPGWNIGTKSAPSYIGGTYGKGIADLFKGHEPNESWSLEIPIIGTVEWTATATGSVISINGHKVFPPEAALIESAKPEGETFFDMVERKSMNVTIGASGLTDAVNNVATAINNKQLDFDCNFGDVNVDMTDVVNAINSLDNALKRDADTIARAIVLLEATVEKTAGVIEDLKVVAIANTGNYANINLCCEEDVQ